MALVFGYSEEANFVSLVNLDKRAISISILIIMSSWL